MARQSAGLLVYRRKESKVHVLLVHPGGPFWARRDEGAWSIPKGESDEDEHPEAVAGREFQEELGVPPPEGPMRSLGSIRQAGGKVVEAWAVEGDIDVTEIRSNTFTVEWPPRSGKMREFPEVDRAGWFDLDSARQKMLEGQRPFIDRLEALL